MTRRLGTLILLLLSSPPACSEVTKRNVLFIVADDMNTDLGCYGHPLVRSPNLDRLAGRGLRFDRAYTQVPICAPARASFLSGLRPDTTQAYTHFTPPRAHIPDAVMLPEQFRRHGYFTAHAGKIFHTGQEFEDPRSWDVEYREFDKNPPDSQILKKGDVKGPRSHTMYWAVLKSRDEETPDGIVARQAVQLMEQAVRENRPFFVAAGFRRPHAPFAAPKKYFDLYPAERIPLPPEAPAPYSTLLPAALNYAPPARPLTDQEKREVIAAYYACNSFVDAQVGVLLEALDRLQLWDDTIVVFFSDHGYHLGDHGGLWHKNSLFERSARVPLIVYAPGMKAAGKASPRLVELVDLYPTLMELCGLPAPPELEGTSFLPLLEEPERPWKRAAFTLVARGEDPSDHTREVLYLGRSLRTERWRYTEWEEGRRGIELYDHQQDPGEMRNLADHPDYSKVVRHLRNLLRAGWKAALPDPE